MQKSSGVHFCVDVTVRVTGAWRVPDSSFAGYCKTIVISPYMEVTLCMVSPCTQTAGFQMYRFSSSELFSTIDIDITPWYSWIVRTNWYRKLMNIL